jgi:UDP-N-acetylglucosamine 2-epimerase (non-hydrolysing)
VTIRENTERPETVEVGANMLAGFSHKGIIDASEKMLRNNKKWRNPFGNGQTGKRIIEISKNYCR